MATTDTNDTAASVAQAKRIIDAGGELVRFTTQGTREAENMQHISAQLKADGYNQPLVADVHFTAHTADIAALYCEKVRINPGDYVDPGRTFKHLEYTDEEYADELQKIEKKLIPLDIDYDDVLSLRLEARQKLKKFKPVSVGQASRISGVSPADVSVLLVYLEHYNSKGDT